MSESTMTIDNNGTKRWKNEAGQLHRLDGPAIEHTNGTKVWYKNGCHHRLDGPAIEWYDGRVAWCHKSKFLGNDLAGFWKFWDRLDEKQRQNVNLHMWLRKLTND